MENTLKYVQQLSLLDEKTLSGKVLKCTEELGELAKEILPYEHQFATTHRFPNKDKVLEEACDLTLAALSIPFTLGYSIDEIMEKIRVKSDKWAGLQEHSRGGKFPLPFEIHITVPNTEHDISIEHFKDVCKVVGVKPILLDLQTKDLEEMMTSSVIVTDNLGVITEVNRISDALRKEGFMVIREKIETVPWHPAAANPIRTGYFESHVAVRITNKVEEDFIKELSINSKWHLSRNKMKVEGDSYTQMLTLRSEGDDRIQFTRKVDDWIECISECSSVFIEKKIVEYAIFDSNISKDKDWLMV